MSQLFASFYTPKRGMYDAQKRIEIAGKNIANTNTEGYSRQKVSTVSARIYNIDIAGKIENGPDALRVMRERDTFLDSQIRKENGIFGQFRSKSEILSQVETSFLEPSDNGLNKAMSEMWNSWQELSKNPSEVSVKTVVTQTAENFALTLNTVAARLEDLKDNSKNIIENEVFNLNKTLERIDNLNNEIYKATIRNIEPNELLDQRDLLLDEVSKSVNIDVTLDKFNRATVTSSGVDLVSGNPKVESDSAISFVDSIEEVAGGYEVRLSLAGDGVKNSKSITISKAEFEANYSFLEEGAVVVSKKDFIDESSISKFEDKMVTGEIKGYKESFEKTKEYSNNLDNLANSIAQRINIIHKDGGSNFFEGAIDGKFTAKSIKMNTEIVNDPSKINADKDDGDGARALAISVLRNSNFSIDSSDTAAIESTYDTNSLEFDTEVTGVSFDSYYTNMISNIGIEKQSADRMVENEEALLQQLDGKKESISGVSLDEEIANLVQFQNVYAANAKVMSTMSEMLDVLMNRTGL
ncbi:flagellar hook-associated protein FlgK [Clostridium sediminicola]|uniref:flagellar hook-associated protein FlgK n=1 Tax=Clostridium sediminicola TaxID=3114879 RepID=UPI0031F226EF